MEPSENVSGVERVQGELLDMAATGSSPATDPKYAEVLEYAKVLAHAVDTFGSRTNANAWLNRPNRIFNNKSPLQVLTENPAAVEEELVRIDHGMFL